MRKVVARNIAANLSFDCTVHSDPLQDSTLVQTDAGAAPQTPKDPVEVASVFSKSVGVLAVNIDA
jgi:hypothetical protein